MEERAGERAAEGDGVAEALLKLGATAHTRLEGRDGERIEYRDAAGGRWVLKLAWLPDAAEGFAAARLAAERLRGAGVVAPEYRSEPREVAGRPALLYPWLPQATLAELWPSLSRAERAESVRSWGALAARIHRLRAPGHGRLQSPDRRSGAEALREEIQREGRASSRAWPEGAGLVERLLALLPALAGRFASDGALLHNDLHRSNLLCERQNGRVRCVGVLDLESAARGAPEADLARPMVLYGPWFGSRIDELPDWLREGYGPRLDEELLDLFLVRHLVVQARRSLTAGHARHAAWVAADARRCLDALEQRHPTPAPRPASPPPPVRVLSRAGAEAYQPELPYEICISISGTPGDRAALSAGFRDVLRLTFGDVDPREAGATTEKTPFAGEHARRILDFLARHPDAQRLVVHCFAGESRSPAVALALHDAGLAGAQDESRWPKHNRWVRERLARAAREQGAARRVA